MSTFLSLAYLFFIGSVCGWLLEVLYRNLTRQQTEKPLSEHLRELQKSFEKRIRRSSDKE